MRSASDRRGPGPDILRRAPTGGISSVARLIERQGAFNARPNWKEQPRMPDDWVKIKNMAHPAIERAMLIALSKRW
jgi:hypothetical protein